jgi:hypothetical protein
VKRPLILLAILGSMFGLALLVARPSREPPAATPYVGKRGASRATSSGLGVSLRRGADVQALAPGTPVRAGDVLRFKVRAESPQYLMVRLRDGAGAPVTIFPAAAAPMAVRVQPGEQLPVEPVVSAGAGKVVVSAVFADAPFAVEGAPPPDAQVIDFVIEKELTQE